MSYQLIEDNIALLKSVIELLGSMDDRQYCMRQLGGEKSGVGPHLRHVIDHYQCLLAGVEGDKIDYDHRERSDLVEVSVNRARQVLYDLIAGLEGTRAIPKDKALLVRMDCGTNNEAADQSWCISSLGRELQFLVSHTVHHFAIIDLFCHTMDVPVPNGFGVAPSTLKYLRTNHHG